MGTTINVITCNVGNGLASPARLNRLLGSSEANVVGLQEVDATLAETVERDLSDAYPYQVVYGTGFAGRGLMSRYPIVGYDLLETASDRPDLVARLKLPECEITVVVAHPSPPRIGRNGITFSPESIAQIQSLLDLASDNESTIILGDFNMTSRNPAYGRLVSAGLVDAFDAAGNGAGATFPVRPGRMRNFNHRMSWMPLPPVTRIDYIWHTADIESLEAWVGPNVGSDHLPVLARLAVSGCDKLAL